MSRLILLPPLLLLSCAAAHAELLLVYSISRHGARNVLPKSAVLTESDASGGPTLLPAGQLMCFNAGETAAVAAQQTAALPLSPCITTTTTIHCCYCNCTVR